MITKNSDMPQTPSSTNAKPGATPVPVMNPRGPIEVGSGGSGTVNDPSGSDIKPPFTGGFEVPV
jgi:hypothetical protein